MGTEPEEIEHALRRERTLPEPGKQPVRAGGPEAEAGKASSPSPESQSPEATAAAERRERKGPKGAMLDADEEHRFGLRGGRWNAASSRDRT